MNESTRRSVIRVLALLVLVGAILPNVTYIGHWTVRGLEEATQVHAHEGDHNFHCHGTSCDTSSGASALQWVTRAHDDLTLDGGPEQALDGERPPSPGEPFISPLDPPPQYA